MFGCPQMIWLKQHQQPQMIKSCKWRLVWEGTHKKHIVWQIRFGLWIKVCHTPPAVIQKHLWAPPKDAQMEDAADVPCRPPAVQARGWDWQPEFRIGLQKSGCSARVFLKRCCTSNKNHWPMIFRELEPWRWFFRSFFFPSKFSWFRWQGVWAIRR
jgi:hypothetical protein